MKRTFALATSALLLTSTAACGGGEASQEKILEELIQNESGEDVDIDLDGDGGFSIETEDGDFSITLDDDGNVQFNSDEGSGTFTADENGGGELEFDSDDGSGTVQVDGDGGFVATGNDGEVVTADIGDDGNFTIEGEDGETTFETSQGIPDQWPSDVPRPEGLDDINGTYISEAGETSILVAGTSSDPEAFVVAYGAALLSAGFTTESDFSDGVGGLNGAVYERGDLSVVATITDLGSISQVVILISSS